MVSSSSVPDAMRHFWLENARSVVASALAEAPPESIAIAFNGGKDCTALLYLVLEQWKIKFPVHNLAAIYIVPDASEEFEEVTAFVNETVGEFQLDLIEIHGKSVKHALADLREIRPTIKFIFMGTRRTDPYASQLVAFAPTDQGWPAFIRVNPILDWTYENVWEYLDGKKVCELYANGYSSLGKKSQTTRNEELKDEKGGWLHARTLNKAETERSGR